MSEKNSKKPRRKYDPDFKADVLRMVETGRSVSEIARSLGISENLIYRWRARVPSQSGDTEGSKDLMLENERLRAELRKTEQERDILKKALGIFSRGT